MYRTFLAMILFVGSNYIHAQKWEKNETDDFTGEPLRITKLETVAANRYRVRFSVIQNGDYYSLKVMHTSTIADDMCKDEGTDIIFRFLDGTTHTLSPTGEIDCGERLIIYYPLSQRDIALLRNHKIEMFRIYYSRGFIDYEMNKEDYFIRTLGFFD